MEKQKLGRYVLMELIGAGSMGEVWRGRDKKLRREVAVKLLPPTLALEKKRRERFVREARLAAQLTHPNIATIHDVGIYEKQVYMAMELVDGTSLQEIVADQGPFAWKRATEIIRDAAKGLGAAHQKGMVHRDVKPENLMLANTGETKVVDFGLAKARLSQTQLTQANTVLGTPAYMSPEQWKGGEIDARSDLYSLICAYYFLLTGKPPFTAHDTAALGYQHRYESLPDPRPAVTPPAAIPDGVCLILQRGAAKDPDARFQKADELVAALDAVLHTPTDSRTFASPWNEIQDETAENAATQLMPSEPAPVIVETPRVESGPRRIELEGKHWAEPPYWRHVAVGFAGCLVLAAIIFVATNNGTLRIELSDPNAEVTVLIDSRISINSSELDRPIKLRAGAHDVVIEGGDYETYSKRVKIRRGQFNLTAELVGRDGTLQLKLSDRDKDADVSVDIDGRERVRNSKPPQSLKLSAGNHQVVVRRTGYEDFEQTVVIEPGKRLALPVRWEPISAAGSKAADPVSPKQGVVATRRLAYLAKYLTALRETEASERGAQDVPFSPMKIDLVLDDGELETRLFRDWLCTNELRTVEPGVAHFQGSFDRQEKLRRVISIGADGEVNEGPRGCSQVRYSYNEQGFVVQEAFFDTVGKPAENDRFVVVARHSYDESGHRIESRFFTQNGIPSEDYLGVHRRVYSEERRPREIRLDGSARIRWLPPMLLPEHINQSDAWQPALSSDGQELFFSTGRSGPSVSPRRGIYRSVWRDGAWSKAESVLAGGEPVVGLRSALSSDGAVLAFVAWKRDPNLSSVQYPQLPNYGDCDVYYTSRRDGPWQSVRSAGPLINTQIEEGGVGFLPGTQTICVARRSKTMNYSLWLADRTGAIWGEPRLMRLPGPQENFMSPVFSSDGKFLFFSSGGKGALEANDIWVSEKSPQGWGRPVNLGSEINAVGNESQIAVFNGGDVIYFDRCCPWSIWVTGRADSEAAIRHLADIYAVNGAILPQE